MKKIVKLLLIAIALLVGSATIYAISLYRSVEETFEQVYVPLEKPKSVYRETPVVVEEREPLSILLFGVDEREGDRGRTDTLVMMFVHPQKKSVLLLPIPRDTRTTLLPSGKEDKINHAYAFGGIQATVDTVEALLQIPVDYYICVNMEGFIRVIDALGGVVVENEMNFQFYDYTFEKGSIHMDGEMALAYSRMRYDDPEGDFGRQKRQQQVIKGILAMARNPSIVSRIDEVLAQVAQSMTTNLTFADARQLVLGYRAAAEEVITERMEGEGRMIAGIYYYVVATDELERLKQSINDFLDMKTPQAS